MKACPLCLLECSDDYDYCPIDGIKLLPFVVVGDDDAPRNKQENGGFDADEESFFASPSSW